MERKSLKRIDTKINAEVSIDGKYYEGSINTFSEDGLFEIVFAEVEVSDFKPDKILRVIFNKPSGEKYNLQCKVVWFRLNKDDLDRLKYCMGMEIISPPATYKKFVKTL
jgi:hypothetical protein